MTQTAMDLPGRDAIDDSRSLVWLEDGTERVFDDAEPNTRTWLEVSSEWVSPTRHDGASRKPLPPDKLIWV